MTVRLDNVQSVYFGGGHIYSVQASADVENGSFGVVGNLVAGEREVREFNTPADLATDSAIVAASAEIIYDESSRASGALANFTNKAGKAFDAHELQRGDILSVSDNLVDAIGADVVVGNKVVMQVGTNKLGEVTSTTTEKFVARIEAVETVGTTTVVGSDGTVGRSTKYVVIRVEKN